jgi:hypothetical protein
LRDSLKPFGIEVLEDCLGAGLLRLRGVEGHSRFLSGECVPCRHPGWMFREGNYSWLRTPLKISSVD